MRWIFRKTGNIMWIANNYFRKDKAKMEREYSLNGEGCFILEVQSPVSSQWICLDATRAFGTLGRLINHDRKPNLRSMAAMVNGTLRVGFLAARVIMKGDELTFNYGHQETDIPWLQRRPPKVRMVSQPLALAITLAHNALITNS